MLIQLLTSYCVNINISIFLTKRWENDITTIQIDLFKPATWKRLSWRAYQVILGQFSACADIDASFAWDIPSILLQRRQHSCWCRCRIWPTLCPFGTVWKDFKCTITPVWRLAFPHMLFIEYWTNQGMHYEQQSQHAKQDFRHCPLTRSEGQDVNKRWAPDACSIPRHWIACHQDEKYRLSWCACQAHQALHCGEGGRGPAWISG